MSLYLPMNDMVPEKKGCAFWNGIEWSSNFANNHTYEVIDRHVEKLSSVFNSLGFEQGIKIDMRKINKKDKTTSIKQRKPTIK